MKLNFLVPKRRIWVLNKDSVWSDFGYVNNYREISQADAFVRLLRRSDSRLPRSYWKDLWMQESPC